MSESEEQQGNQGGGLQADDDAFAEGKVDGVNGKGRSSARNEKEPGNGANGGDGGDPG